MAMALDLGQKGVPVLVLDDHDGLDEEASQALNARLILILANHIRDRGVLSASLALARKSQSRSKANP